ncbi:MAG: response regulator [bacterium]
MKRPSLRPIAWPGGMRGILVAFFLGTSVLLAGVLVALLLTTARPALRSALERRAQSYANDVAAEAGFCLAVGDTLRLRTHASALANDDEVHHVIIRDGRRGVVIVVPGPAHAKHRCPPTECPGLIVASAMARPVATTDDDVFALESRTPPTERDGPPVAEVAMSPARIDGTVGRWIALTLLAVSAFGVALVRGLMPRVVDPILALADASVEVARGRLAMRVVEDAPAELGRLQASFNGMVAALQAQEGSLLTKNAELEQSLHQTQALYEELKQTQNAMVKSEKLRAIGEMASGVAHDFNNVLAAVLGRTQLLELRVDQGRLDQDEAKRSLAVIRQAAEDGARTVQRLQQYTRGTLQKALQPVDLAKVVRTAVDMMTPRWRTSAQREGWRIDVNIDLAPDSVVAGDESDLRDVLVNLINNALDAMPEGGTLHFSSQRVGDQVVLHVRDTGVGMDEDTQRRAFDPFFTTKGTRGTGLGLSTVAGVVRQLGGKVQLQSRRGEGTRITIELQAWSGARHEAAQAPETAAADQRMSCLVVDDNETALDNLREMLEMFGQRVVAVDTGAAAVKLLARETFDVVITDLGMPDVNGWQVAASAQQSRPGLPVILCTGWSDEIDPAALRERGVSRLLPKPYTMSQLESALRGLEGNPPAVSVAGSPSPS